MRGENMADNQNDISGKVGLDVTDFKAAVVDLNRQIRVVESGFKAAAAGMDDWRTTSTGLQSRIESLNKVTDLQLQKINNLADEYLKIVEAKGKDSSAAENLEIKINKETAALNKNIAEIDNCKTALNNLDDESKKAGQGVEDLGKKSEEAEKKESKMGSGFKDVSNNLSGATLTATKAVTGAVVGMGVAAVGAAAGAYKLAESASDLVEGQNVVEQVFKSSGKSVEDWTNTMANSAGIGKTTATQWVGSMGAMMKSSGLSEKSAQGMSESLVQLTGDMSSFYNINNNDMWEKIRSGISGETMPLKELGINMDVANLSAYALSQGIHTAYDKMSQSEQTTLRYNYLMSVTKDAQGDFARTLGGSFANQVRVAQMNLQTLGQSIGQLVLPAFMNMTKGLNTMMGEINKALGDGFQKGDLSKISTVISKTLTDAIKELNKEIPKIMAVAIPVLNSVINSIVQILPTLLPLLLQGVLQLINGLMSAIEQNATKLSALAINLIGQLANFIITAVPKMLPAALQIILGLVNGITQSLPKLIPVALKAIVSFGDFITNNLGKIIDAGIKLLIALAQGISKQLPFLIKEVPRLINNFANALYAQLPQLIVAGVEIILILIKGIIQAIPTLIANLPQIILAIVNAITLFNWASVGKGLITKIGDGISAMQGNIGNIAKSIAEWIQSTIINIFKGGLSWGRSLISDLGGGISSMKSYLASIVESVVDSGLKFIISLPGKMLKWGEDMISNFIQGIKNKVGGVISAVTSVAGAVSSFLHHSVPDQGPLANDDEWGSDFVQNLVDGMQKNKQSLINTTKGLANNMKVNLQTPLSTNIEFASNSNMSNAKNNSTNLNSLIKGINDAISLNNTAKKQPITIQLLLQNSQAIAEYVIDDLDLLQGKKAKILARGQGI